jgi:hypothetical protein
MTKMGDFENANTLSVHEMGVYLVAFSNITNSKDCY